MKGNYKKKYHKLQTDLFHSISLLGLDWCKAITSDSGWVSDNYLAYARLSKWIYHPLSTSQSNRSEEDKYTEPTLSIKYWNKTMCKE